MLVDYAVIEMSCFDDYSEAAPRFKAMRGNVINTFIFQVDQCITFNQTQLFTATLIAKAQLKSLYSRLDFKVINDFVTSNNLKKARMLFHYGSEKSNSS